ncbi:MAG: GNAT family N-acetyltransferase [Bacilli bacterium]|nr:GNAT family N-acetyltransferase [Bacilli bacterium]
MSNICIKELDSTISFEEIKLVMEKAHKAAENDKLSFPTSNLSASDLMNKTLNNGKWFLAINNDKIVGTLYGDIKNIKKWFYIGTVVELKYIAILPEFSGKHILSKLYEKVFTYAKKNKIELCFMSMSEYNYHHRHVAEKNGFILIDFFAAKGLKNYSLSYAYWLEGNCPYSKIRIRMMLQLRKIKAIIKRKILKY